MTSTETPNLRNILQKTAKKCTLSFFTVYFCIHIHFLFLTCIINKPFQLLKLFILSLSWCPIQTCALKPSVGIGTRHAGQLEHCTLNCNFLQTILNRTSFQQSHSQNLCDVMLWVRTSNKSSDLVAFNFKAQPSLYLKFKVQRFLKTFKTTLQMTQSHIRN